MITIPEVSIRIESAPTTDFYLRAHAKAVDGALDDTGHWQETQPEYFIGFYGGAFTHEQKVDLRAGRHSIEYAASGYTPKGVLKLDYAWHAKIYVNDKLIAEGDVGREASTHLKGYFAIGPLALKALPMLGILPIPSMIVGVSARRVGKAKVPTRIPSIKTY